MIDCFISNARQLFDDNGFKTFSLANPCVAYLFHKMLAIVEIVFFRVVYGRKLVGVVWLGCSLLLITASDSSEGNLSDISRMAFGRKLVLDTNQYLTIFS